jgi:hypothetical protein
MEALEKKKYQFKTVEGDTVTLQLTHLEAYDYRIDRADHIALKYPNVPEFSVKAMPRVDSKPGRVIGEWRIAIDRETDDHGNEACVVSFESQKDAMVSSLRERFRFFLIFEVAKVAEDRDTVYYRLTARPSQIGKEGNRYKEFLENLNLINVESLLGALKQPTVGRMPDRAWVFGPDSQPFNCTYRVIMECSFVRLEGYHIVIPKKAA